MNRHQSHARSSSPPAQIRLAAIGHAIRRSDKLNQRSRRAAIAPLFQDLVRLRRE